MNQILIIFVSAMLTDNVILSRFMGICPFLGVSGSRASAKGMGIAVAVVIMMTTVIIYPVRIFLEKNNMGYMETIMFILIIAAVVQLLEMVIRRFNKELYNSLGVYLALITTNCAVLGTSVRCAMEDYDFARSVIYAAGVSAGFAVAIIIMAGIRERIDESLIPDAFCGMPIVLVTAGLMAIAFTGLAGIGG